MIDTVIVCAFIWLLGWFYSTAFAWTGTFGEYRMVWIDRTMIAILLFLSWPFMLGYWHAKTMMELEDDKEPDTFEGIEESLRDTRRYFAELGKSVDPRVGEGRTKTEKK